MKRIGLLFSLAAAALLGACATPQQVSHLEGHGIKTTYNATFDQAWRAAVDAAQMGDLHIVNADRSTGYIDARRGLRPETFGENVGIWVRPVSAVETEVEVVSRQAGPPVLYIRNWEKRIQEAIAANLTRDVGIGATGPSTTVIQGNAPLTTAPVVPSPAPGASVTVPPPGQVYPTPVVPSGTVTPPLTPPPSPTVTIPPPPSTTVVVPAPVIPAPPVNDTVTIQQTREQIRALQAQQQAQEALLLREQDIQRRAAIQDDIDILRKQLRDMQIRLNQLETDKNRIP
ncbi:MAG TPA: hypothetical protein VGE41_09700 [Verrucomicrobiae bacterium]|jgi:hypothetical protein